jgi:acetyltransferase-like isoleucine patch superfamily enzyme
MIFLVARARIFAKYGVRSLRYLRNKLTILWLRAKGCEIDWAVNIHPDAVFDLSGGEIKIGAHTSIDKGAIIRGMGGQIKIGSNCSVNAYSFLSGAGGLDIADCVMIASHVSIYASNHVISDTTIPMNRQGMTMLGIVVREDVWIGTGARILDGVELARGCVIAAGAVVTKSTQPFTLNGGVPAHIIGSRLSNDGAFLRQ